VSRLVTIAELRSEELIKILELSQRSDLGTPLAGKGVALVFQKPSTRTRNSMEMAVFQLGGHPVYIQKEEVGLRTRETPEDVARTLACYYDILAARVTDHDDLDRMGRAVPTPLLNLLSDLHHPLQALADLLTIKQLVGELRGSRVAYVGDANNVARSLAEACSLTGVELTLACPAEYCFAADELARWPGVRHVVDPGEAVRNAQIVYTDVWVSMGQDSESEERRKAFAAYQVDETLMAKAADAWFLHCLPARRGEEVTDAVIDGPRSAIWRQAENRLHTSRGALAWLIGSK
jgi:ornithine carbamoyltransferase